MKLGWSNNDACKAVGICRKTGTRWRLGRHETKKGRKHSYPPVDQVVSERISPRFLSAAERIRVADLRRLGTPIRGIAAELGRSASTISRELRRNATLVERTTRYLILVHLPERRTAKAMTAALVPVLQALPASLRLFADLGPGQRTRPALPHHCRNRDDDLFLPRPLTLGTRYQREHERTASTILSQRL